MKVRSVALAFVSSVYLVALGANFGSALATTNSVTTEAYQALASGDSLKAIALYSTAIESRGLEPEVLANALLNRALAHQQLGQSAIAIDDYTAALSLDAMSSDLRATALYNRGFSQQKLGNTPLAIEDFTSALMLNPSFAHAFLGRANALRESGQYLFALSDYERALKFQHPEPARVYFGEAQTYELLGRPADARQMLNSALMADANFKPARDKLLLLAAASAADGQADAAEQSAVDPILTGSVMAVGGSTIVHKPDLPQGIEPPAELMASDTASQDTMTANTETAEFQKTPKVYTDRLASTEESVATTSATAEENVAVDSVPEIPKSIAKIGAKIAPKKAPVADTIETASTTEVAKPVGVAPAGWGVQIASAVSEDAAWTTFKNLQKRYKALAGKTPIVVKADLGSKGIFYRVRLVGFTDQTGAKSECGSLKGKGVACFVSKSDG